MIIIGHNAVPYKKFAKARSIDDIKEISANKTVLIEGENFLEIAKHCSENSVKYACKIDKIKDALLLSALNATYIITELDSARSFQKLADEYMFDSKILCLIQSDDEIEDVANEFIDGVIYKGVIDGES
ncbi:MAG: hypothetical protein ACOCP1_01290 [Campylobacterales bacterium]